MDFGRIRLAISIPILAMWDFRIIRQAPTTRTLAILDCRLIKPESTIQVSVILAATVTLKAATILHLVLIRVIQPQAPRTMYLSDMLLDFTRPVVTIFMWMTSRVRVLLPIVPMP